MNNQSNRKHRNEAYPLERRNEHSGVEGEGCRGDRKHLMLPYRIFDIAKLIPSKADRNLSSRRNFAKVLQSRSP